MRVHLLSSISLVCASAALAPAQGTKNYATSPAGFLSTEGGVTVTLPQHRFWTGASQYFGSYPDMRVQILDDTHRGAGIRVISAIDFRMDQNERPHAAEARSWTNVTIDAGTGDYLKSTDVFSTNFSATPTQVFSNAVKWPQVSGTYTSLQPWGAVASFPINPFVQTNLESTIWDFQFSGGALANGGTWDDNNPNDIFFDAAYINRATVGYNYGSSAVLPNASPCRDSSLTADTTSYLTLQTWAKDSPVNADSFRWDEGIFSAPPNHPFVMAYSTGQVNPVIPFPGTNCNGIKIDLAQTFLYQAVTTNTGGRHRRIRNVQYVPVPPGVRLNLQSVWNDTNTGQLLLTNVSLDELQQQPPGKIMVVHQVGAAAAKREMESRWTPTARYTY